MQSVNIYELAASSTFNRFHGLLLFWCILIVIVDGYELAAVGAALPSIMTAMNIDATTAGMMAGLSLVGTMLGAIFLGTLSDRIGRPKMIAVCVTLFSIFTAAAGLTSDPITFSISRFIAGLGIGGILPVVTAQMSEYSPLKLRTRLLTLVFTGFSVGGVLVALTGKQLIESHGWQWIFFVAGLPIVLVPFILKTMPESAAFLIKHGRQQKLRTIALQINPDLLLDKNTIVTGSRADTATQGSPVRSLFRDGRSLSTIMIWIAFITGLFMVNALSSWLTKLMAMAGFSLGSALNFVIVFNVGAIVGAIVGGWLSDKLNIKYVLISFYIVGAISLSVLGYTRSTTALFFVVFIVGASTLGTQLLAYAYAGGFYPSTIRATGVGFASGIGRTGAIVAPVLIGFIVSLNLPLEHNFLAIAIAGVIGAVAVMFVSEARSDSAIIKKMILASSNDRESSRKKTIVDAEESPTRT